MSTIDTSLVTFKAISNFTSALASTFGDSHRPLKLYCHLISKTKIAHEKPIQKHMSAFKNFCTKNRQSILTKNVDSISGKIIYSERVYIDIKDILENSDTVTKNIIWTHLLTISALVDPSGNAKKILKQNNKPGKEVNFLSGIMSSVEEHVDPDSSNPMEAVGNIMKSGVFTDLIQGMTEGLSDGSLDMGKLMGEVGNMVGKLSEDAGDQSGGKEAVDMLNKMMSGMGNTEQSDGDEPPDLGGMMAGMMSGMMSGGNGMPDIGGMMNGNSTNSIDDIINAQLQQAKNKGKL